MVNWLKICACIWNNNKIELLMLEHVVLSYAWISYSEEYCEVQLQICNTALQQILQYLIVCFCVTFQETAFINFSLLCSLTCTNHRCSERSCIVSYILHRMSWYRWKHNTTSEPPFTWRSDIWWFTILCYFLVIVFSFS